MTKMITLSGRYESFEAADAVAAEMSFAASVAKTSFVCDPFVVQRDVEVGDFLNLSGYSDTTPYQVVRLSASGKTAYVREVSATLDPTWKPEMHAGGFSAHCSNNHEQRWVYGELEGEEMAVRLGKKGWKSAFGMHKASATARRFYDYNF